MRPYLITLQADLPNPFIPLPAADDDDDDDDEAAHPSTPESEGDDVDDALADDAAGSASDDEDEEYDDEFAEEDADAESEDWRRHRRPVVASHATAADPSEPAAQMDDGAAASPEAAAGEAPSSAKDRAPSNGKEPKPMRIDLEGIERRIIPFPVSDGRYGQIAGIGGKVLFTLLPMAGVLDNDDEWGDGAEGATLRCYTFSEYKTETLAENISWFQLSHNRKKLLYAAQSRLRVLTAGEKPQTESGPARRTGWIDLYRVKVAVEPQREWEQMFREAWRLQRDHFWTEDMSEVDWRQVYERYYPLIQRVSSRSEFSDLMWEMQGELGTSHAYEYGGDYRPHPPYSQGFLGTTFTWDEAAGGYRVGPLLIGDPWDAGSTSPLAAPGVDVAPGDLLLAINGQRLDVNIPPAQLLVNQAGQDVLLTFAARPQPEGEAPVAMAAQTGETTALAQADEAPTTMPRLWLSNKASSTDNAGRLRSAIVRTIYGEEKANYRAWVNRNRQQVYAATGGRVGYVHIPDMGPTGYAEFHRSYLAEVDREALIVDVRYNGGGHVSQLILEKLARRRLGYDFSRWSGLEPYPADSVAGPIVALTNEHAGSDGDIFCHSFKVMQLGPLIGKRTWGGVVGISPHHALVDGTVTTQPEFSFWFTDVGWGIENYGAEPDIEVDIRPQDYRVGEDPQLARAIAEAMQRLAERPVVKPDLATRPSRALPKLPPRL
jgi:tricorn protease